MTADERAILSEAVALIAILIKAEAHGSGARWPPDSPSIRDVLARAEALEKRLTDVPEYEPDQPVLGREKSSRAAGRPAAAR